MDVEFNDVEFNVSNGIGTIELNRPKAINSLTLEMLLAIDAQLADWENDPEVTEIAIRGAGERGFCAGADVRVLREQCMRNPQETLDFLFFEYDFDGRIARYSKPMTVYYRGVSMGGGLGFTNHGSHRVATQDVKMAMPEVGIGLWPDVAMTYPYSKAPGETGTYLAMSGATYDAASALYAGLVDEVVGGVDPETSQLAQDRVWIDECFVGDDAGVILAALESHENPRAREAAEVIRSKSPLSVCVALESIRRAAQASELEEVLFQDTILATHFVHNPDFVEGVRAQVVEKDYAPNWQHARVEDVSREELLSYFVPRALEAGEGWAAITAAATSVYPDQDEPLQFANTQSYEDGGDPLDQVSVYSATDSMPHWHYVGYGLTDVFDSGISSVEESGTRLSGFGYEFTMRIADENAGTAGAIPAAWPPAMMQLLAHQVVESGEAFVHGSLIMTPNPLVKDVDTPLTCLIFVADPSLPTVLTNSGEVRFLQAIGITTEEAQSISLVGLERFLEVYTRLYPLGVTVLDRPDLMDNEELVGHLIAPDDYEPEGFEVISND